MAANSLPLLPWRGEDLFPLPWGLGGPGLLWSIAGGGSAAVQPPGLGLNTPATGVPLPWATRARNPVLCCEQPQRG